MTADTTISRTLDAVLGALSEQDDHFREELTERLAGVDGDTTQRLYYQMLIDGGIPWTAVIRKHLVTAEFQDDDETYKDALAEVLTAVETAFSYMLSACLVRSLTTKAALGIANRFADHLRDQMCRDIVRMGEQISAGGDDDNKTVEPH